jgi:hypothetical protein
MTVRASGPGDGKKGDRTRTDEAYWQFIKSVRRIWLAVSGNRTLTTR